MNDPTAKQIYAKAIGELALSYLESFGCPAITNLAESRALTVISKIKGILDAEDLDESDSYGNIMALVAEFYSQGFCSE